MSTTRIAPVGIVLPSSAMAVFPPASLAAMMPEPTTVATSRQVPSASAARRRLRSKIMVPPAVVLSDRPVRRAGGRCPFHSADRREACLQGGIIETIERQGNHRVDTSLEAPVGERECRATLVE